MAESVIEKVFFPKLLSYETYKERKSNYSQILTQFGKWWGRKPLVYVRALLLGALLPASGDIEKDTEIYMKVLGLSDRELIRRKNKNIEPVIKYGYLIEEERKRYRANIEFKSDDDIAGFKEEIARCIGDKADPETLSAATAFDYADDQEKKQYFKVSLNGLTSGERAELEDYVFLNLPYELKLRYCAGLDKLDNLSEETWEEINQYLGTDAYSYQELVEQLGRQRFGEVPTVGDCFCGGGSVPFEAARLGFNVYASDLNPVAMLLTWAALNILSLPEQEIAKLKEFQDRIFEMADRQVTEWGIEHNSQGHRANAFLYCMETTCPDCGWKVPMSPTWVIGQGTGTVAMLKENPTTMSFDIQIKMHAGKKEMEEAKKGTIVEDNMVCPYCKNSTSISAIRGDKKDEAGNLIWGLRRWEKHEFMPRKDDVFTERLYCIRYEDENGNRYYKAPDVEDLKREQKVIELLSERFDDWQDKGYIPSDIIEEGENTNQLIREQGWAYWHQLFNPRQLLLNGLLMELVDREAKSAAERVIGLVGVNKCCNWNSKLSIWNSARNQEKGEQTFYNQALNTLNNYSTKGLTLLPWSKGVLKQYISNAADATLYLSDARNISNDCHVWLTDPPYADAVNYHELSEFFLAWDKALLKKAFPDWYTDSKRALAVKGTGDDFGKAMTDIFRNMADHTVDGGYIIIMFTHQSAKVFADLVQILLSTGLRIMNAWSVATETESTGLDQGNYIQSTVAIILKKDAGYEKPKAFIRGLRAAAKSEVENQVKYMMDVENSLTGNKIFTSADLELAGYYAALRILTAYDITEPAERIAEFLEDMRSYASNLIIPQGFKELPYDTDTVKSVWDSLNNYEKYYIRCIEFERENERKIKLYQDTAKGLGILDYDDLFAENRANKARVKTAIELGMTLFENQHGFSRTILRYILAAISTVHEITAETGDENAAIGLGLEWMKGRLGMEYVNKRQNIEVLLKYISNQSILPHWAEDANIARYLLERVMNDRM